MDQNQDKSSSSSNPKPTFIEPKTPTEPEKSHIEQDLASISRSSPSGQAKPKSILKNPSEKEENESGSENVETLEKAIAEEA